MQAHQGQPSLMSYVIPIAIFVLVMAFRMRSMSRMRPLKLGSLWIVPALYLVITVVMFIQLPPVGWVAIASGVGLLIGLALGWQRGKLMQIHVDPETHALNQKASPAAIIILIALILVRNATRMVPGMASHVSPAMLTDPLIAFALGMFTATRLEMYIRAKRLLDSARAAR